MKKKFFYSNIVFIFGEQLDDMKALDLKSRIEKETGLKISVKKGTGSMFGYILFTVRDNQNFDYDYSRNLIKEFPSCDLKPAFANNYQIHIYHGLES